MFLEQKEVTGCKARWLDHLQGLNLKFKHIAGKKNVVADALSRILLGNIWEVRPDDETLTLIELGMKEDKFLGDIIVTLLHPDTVSNHHKIQAQHFELDTGGALLYTGNGREQICVPKNKELRARIVHDHHTTKFAGHLGVEKTLKELT